MGMETMVKSSRNDDSTGAENVLDDSMPPMLALISPIWDSASSSFHFMARNTRHFVQSHLVTVMPLLLDGYDLNVHVLASIGDNNILSQLAMGMAELLLSQYCILQVATKPSEFVACHSLKAIHSNVENISDWCAMKVSRESGKSVLVDANIVFRLFNKDINKGLEDLENTVKTNLCSLNIVAFVNVVSADRFSDLIARLLTLKCRPTCNVRDISQLQRCVGDLHLSERDQRPVISEMEPPLMSPPIIIATTAQDSATPLVRPAPLMATPMLMPMHSAPQSIAMDPSSLAALSSCSPMSLMPPSLMATPSANQAMPLFPTSPPSSAILPPSHMLQSRMMMPFQVNPFSMVLPTHIPTSSPSQISSEEVFNSQQGFSQGWPTLNGAELQSAARRCSRGTLKGVDDRVRLSSIVEESAEFENSSYHKNSLNNSRQGTLSNPDNSNVDNKCISDEGEDIEIENGICRSLEDGFSNDNAEAREQKLEDGDSNVDVEEDDDDFDSECSEVSETATQALLDGIRHRFISETSKIVNKARDRFLKALNDDHSKYSEVDKGAGATALASTSSLDACSSLMTRKTELAKHISLLSNLFGSVLNSKDKETQALLERRGLNNGENLQHALQFIKNMLDKERVAVDERLTIAHLALDAENLQYQSNTPERIQVLGGLDKSDEVDEVSQSISSLGLSASHKLLESCMTRLIDFRCNQVEAKNDYKIEKDQYKNEIAMLRERCDEAYRQLDHMSLSKERYKRLTSHLKLELKQKDEKMKTLIENSKNLKRFYREKQLRFKDKEERQEMTFNEDRERYRTVSESRRERRKNS